MPYAFPRRFSSTVSSLTLFVAAAAVAQVPEDTTMLPPIVVTAARIPIPVDRVASAVTVLTAAQLRVAGYRTVADALRDTPAASIVTTGSFGGQTSLFLRGGESDYVKVMLDGVTLNQPGGAFDFADLSLENVERIEIVRGPGSVLYGSDAMTGVVQIFTRTGAGPSRATATLRAGTYGTLDGVAGVAGAAGPLAYAAEAGRLSSDGVLPFNNQYERSAGGARLRYTPDARTDVTVALRYADQTYHYPTDGAGIPVDSNAFRFERGPAWSLEAGHVVSPRLAVRVSYGAKKSEQGIDDSADGPADTSGFYGFQLRERAQRSAFGARADWRVGSGMVSLGADLERQRLDGTSESQSQYGPFTDPPSHHRRRNDAVYLQVLSGLEGPLSVQAGARVDENGQFGRFLTARGGAVYRLDLDTRIRAGFGTGFKEPTFFENFAQGFVLGNPNLLPERTRSWEVGLEHRVGRATLNVGYFDQAFRDLIEYNGAPPPPDTLNYFNITGAAADGVEAEVRADLGRGWLATLRYTYLDTRVTHPGFDASATAAFAPGMRLLRRPSDQALFRLHAPVAGSGTVILDLHYTGDRDDIDYATFTRVTLGGGVRVNLGAEYDIALTPGLGLAVTARVENLLADDMRDVANYPARGRVVFLGGRVRAGR